VILEESSPEELQVVKLSFLILLFYFMATTQKDINAVHYVLGRNKQL
jgi:hypothetical protein